MAAELANTCLSCDSPIDGDADCCPGCGCRLVRCIKADCGKSYPADEGDFCPHCGTCQVAGDGAPGTIRHADPAETEVEGGGPPAEQPAAPAPPGTPNLEWQQAFHRAFGSDTAPEANAAPLPAHAVANIRPSVPVAAPPPHPAEQEAAGARLALETSAVDQHRRDHKSLVHVRVRAVGLAEEAVVELLAEADFFDPPVEQRTPFGPDQVHEYAALKFIPKFAGHDEIRFTITLKSALGAPLGKWSAVLVLAVQDVVAPASGRIEAGGDVYIFGSDSPGTTATLDTAVSPLEHVRWKPLELKPDRAFNYRAARACPVRPTDCPAIPEKALWPAATPFHAAVHLLRDSHPTPVRTVAVVVGSSASLGRGNAPGEPGADRVTWRLRPAPYDDRQHGRLSRHHLSLELRNGRASATDVSTNGTWLNGRRLARGELTLVADGDRLEPAQVVGLPVRLIGDGQVVRAINLERSDALAGRLGYLLTDGRLAIPMTLSADNQSLLWLAWVRGRSSEPLMAVWQPGQSKWAVLGEGQSQAIDARWHLAWQRFAVPVEEEQYLCDASFRAGAGSGP